MRRENRLASEADFRRARGEGRSWAHPMATLHTRANGTTRVRVGVSTSTRLGNAVLRNRLRRRVRELVRARLTRVRKGWDIVFVVRAPATAASFVSLGSAIDQLLARAGLIEPQSETVSQTGITTTE